MYLSILYWVGFKRRRQRDWGGVELIVTGVYLPPMRLEHARGYTLPMVRDRYRRDGCRDLAQLVEHTWDIDGMCAYLKQLTLHAQTPCGC